MDQLIDLSRQFIPRTKIQLKTYCDSFLNLNVPDKKICPNHCAPLDYLWHSFSSDFLSSFPLPLPIPTPIPNAISLSTSLITVGK
jgi:hypothetical protein